MMKETLRRVLPYAALTVDMIVLWATVTNNDYITLDNLRFQLTHLIGHTVDIQLYDWVFDCLQSLPEKYSDFNAEELTQQLIEKLDLPYWYLAETSSAVASTLTLPDYLCQLGFSLEKSGHLMQPVVQLMDADRPVCFNTIIVA